MTRKTKFKQTEVGEIPENWEETTLGGTAAFHYGKGLPQKTRINGGVPVFGSSGVTGYHNEALVNKPGYIIGRKGSVGTVYYSESPFFPIDTVYYATESDIRCDFRFFYYLLKHLGLNKLNSDSAVPGLNRNAAYLQKLVLPKSIKEQQRIVSILSSLDDKIELNRKMNKTLEEIGQALFKHWFVDFEFPNERGKPYKSSGGKMSGSESGEIPKGWNSGTIEDFAQVKSGFAFKSKDFRDTGKYGVIKIKNIIDPEVDTADIQYISSELDSRAQKFVLDSGDILIAMSGNTTGKIGIVVKTNHDLVLNQRVGKYFLKQEQHRWYLYSFLRSGDNQKEIIQSAYGSAQPNISPSILENVQIPIPQENIVQKFTDIIQPLMNKYIMNLVEVDILSRLRDSVSPRLMSGKLRIKV